MTVRPIALRAKTSSSKLSTMRWRTIKAANERRLRELEAAEQKRLHLDTLMRRGESVWREVETLIKSRKPSGYDKTVALLADLL